jgi:sorbitol-6-phosphate 2-dehydrogenase
LESLSGKTVVITGGAQGLGRALALRAKKEGANVAIGDFNIEGAKETASMIDGAIAVKMDVTDYASCEYFMDEVYEKFGSIDVLVCNAAIVISGSLDEFEANAWKKVIDVNLCGFFNTAKAAVKYLRKSEGANIIQINSK